nr:HAMP domain-containing protein [Chloroflexota bacterium]
MNRLRLTTLLLSLNVGLLLAAVAGVAYVAATLLRQTADEQALARVAQAAAGARNDIHRSGDDLQARAQLLAERPTLSRLLLENNSQALLPFLNQFQQTGQLSGCAILRGGRLVAECGATLPWEALWAAHHQSPDFFFYRHGDAGPLVLGAWSAIPTVPGGSVMVALLLDEAYAQSLSAEIGLHTTLPAPDPAALTVLQRQALNGGQTATARLAQPDAYAAVTPLIEPGGSMAGLVQTELPATDITRSLDRLRRTLLLLAVSMGAAAAIGSLALGRWLGRPLQSLTAAAEHMGLGDLDTPIPSAGGMEIGALAATLEDMRRRLLRLTADLRREQAESNAIVTGIVEGVFTVNRERRIAYMNPQAAAMLGIEVREAVGRFCGDVLDP